VEVTLITKSTQARAARTPWTPEQEAFLVANYPAKGRAWCASAMGMTDAQIRQKASRMKLRAMGRSEAWIIGQAKAAKSKIGKKRPGQSAVMKRLHREGKLVSSFDARSRASKRAWATSPKMKPPTYSDHPRGMLKKKHSDEARGAIGRASRKHWSTLTGAQIQERSVKTVKTRVANGNYALPRPNTTWKGGWREIGGVKKYYRSRWEANFARYLQWLKERNEIASWAHEPKVFWFDGIRRGTVSYLPDFCVIENNGKEVYYEVKGWMDKRSATKLKRMKKYHPDVTLILVAQKQYEAIARSVSKLIQGWE
jgi:hypothetical protein